MTTTTAEAIVAKTISVIGGLTPLITDKPRFVRAPLRYPLRDWALRQAGTGSAITRLFEVRTVDAQDDPDRDDRASDISVMRVSQPMMVTVAYSTQILAAYGLDDLDDLEDVMETDAKQIRDAIYPSGGIVGAGHQGTKVSIEEPDRTNAAVWFQPLALTAEFWVAQSLTL